MQEPVTISAVTTLTLTRDTLTTGLTGNLFLKSITFSINILQNHFIKTELNN